MTCKAVLYDLGDIFFEAHYWREWNYTELRTLGCFVGSFAEFYDEYDSFLEEVYTTESLETYESAFTKFLLHAGVPDRAAFTARSFAKKKEFEDNRVLFDGVKETLIYVHSKAMKNVIITDNESGEEEVRNTILSKHFIDQFIDLIVTSKDVGATKPDPKIFFHALARLDMKPSEVLFVGHDRDELEGAAAIGIATVEYNNYLGRRIHTDYTIAGLAELTNII